MRPSGNKLSIDFEKILRTADKSNLTDGELRMFIAVASRINEYGFCETSNDTFCRKFNKSERTITSWISSLEKKEIIKVIFNSHKHKRHIYIKVAGLVKLPYQPITNENLMTEAQLKFHKFFPDYPINCDWPAEYDMEAVLSECKKSWFLRNNNMRDLASFKRNYNAIVAGRMTDMSRRNGSDEPNFEQRNYSRAQMNALFQDIDEIEI